MIEGSQTSQVRLKREITKTLVVQESFVHSSPARGIEMICRAKEFDSLGKPGMRMKALNQN